MNPWTHFWKFAAVALPLASGAVSWHFSRQTFPSNSHPSAAFKPAKEANLKATLKAIVSPSERTSAEIAYIQTCPIQELLRHLEKENSQPWNYSQATNRAVVDRLLADAPEQLLKLVGSNFGLDVAVRSWVPPHLKGVEVYLANPPNLAASDGATYYRALHDGDFATIRKLLEKTQPKSEQAIAAAQVGEVGGMAALAATLGEDAEKIEKCFEVGSTGSPAALWDFCLTKTGPLREKLIFKALMRGCYNQPGEFAKRFPQLTEDERRQFLRKPGYSEFLKSLEDYDAFVAGADVNDPVTNSAAIAAMSPKLRLEQAKRDLPEGSNERESALLSAVSGMCAENYADRDSIGDAFRDISKESPALQLKCLGQVISKTEPFHESLILPLLQQANQDQLASLLSNAPAWLWERQEGLIGSLVAKLPADQQAAFQVRKLLETPDSPELRDYFSEQLAKGDQTALGQLGRWSKGRETEALALIQTADPQKAPQNSLAVINAWWARDSEAASAALQTMVAGLPPEMARDVLLKVREADPFGNRTIPLEAVPPAAIASNDDFQRLIGNQALIADPASWARWESQLTPQQRGFSEIQNLAQKRAAQEKLRKLLED